MTDFDLLREYSARRSEEAFATLAKRYTNLVYSAALRQSGDPHTAEEIAQLVFITLARKASSIGRGVVLSGWLLRTTRFVALNTRRRELHRRQLEHEAMNLNLYATETNAAWTQIAPVLDEALVGLGAKDRDAIVLRFFNGMSFAEIGNTLGTTEDNAQKRVSRAIDKLRANFAKRGMVLPAALIAAAISAEAVKAAPAYLATTITGKVISQVTAGSLVWMRKWILGSVGAIAVVATLSLASDHFRARQVAGAVVAVVPVQPAASVPISNSNQISIPATLPPAASRSNSTLLLRVIDAANGKPVTGARLTQNWNRSSTNVTFTDAQGESTLPMDLAPAKSWNFRIEVFKDGYVPEYVSWSAWQGDAKSDIPSEFTTKLTPAVTIGGRMLNAAGEPIPNVRIVFSVSGPSPGGSRERERFTMMGHYHTETTDADGRWSCNHIPAKFRMITFETRHPDYISARFGAAGLKTTNEQGQIYFPESNFLNGDVEIILQPGMLVAGTVVDESGNAVAGAKVTANRDWREPVANQETGEDGHFRFGYADGKPMVLTVQAKGFAPRDLTVKPGAATAAMSFTLSAGAPLRVRVMSAAGKPIANARIRFSQDEFNRQRFAWSAKTDKEGRLEWPSAPTSEETYDVEADGYESKEKVTWLADGAEHAVTLHKSSKENSIRISGMVIDNETRQLIEAFKFLSENKVSNGSIFYPSGSGSAGKFSFSIDDSVLTNVVEIRADGYIPVRVTNNEPFPSEIFLNVGLKRGDGIAGVVQLPDGAPAAGATVILDTGHDARMRLPGEIDIWGDAASSTETDEAGHFAFQPRLNINRIFVAHPAGYAEIFIDQFSAANALVLQPWGRVEGILKIGHHPGSGETVSLGSWYWRGETDSRSPLDIILQTEADADGHFVFDKVPPGEREVSHQLGFHNGRTGMIPLSDGRLVQVSPGTTAQVSIGGTGRRVVGRIEVKDPDLHVDWLRDVQSLASKMKGFEEPAPSAWVNLSADEQTSLQNRRMEYFRSPAGREAQIAQHSYVPVFETNGSFRVDDVLPGDYVLSVYVTTPGPSENLNLNTIDSKPIGHVTKEITVPDGDVESAFDVGVLELNLDHP